MAFFPIKTRTKPRPEQMKRINIKMIKKFVEVDDKPGFPEQKMKQLHLQGCFNIKKHKPEYGNIRISYSKPI